MIRKFHIRSSVFIWFSDKNALLYDTKTYSHLLLPMTDETKEIFDQVARPEAMYSFSLDDNNSNLSRLLDIVKSMGFCVEEKENDCFISLPPIVGINYNWEILKKEGKRLATIELLRSISFILGRNDLCEPLAKTSFFTPQKKECLLNLQELDAFFRNNNLNYLKHLFFIVGDECTIEYLSKLKEVITKHKLESITKIIYIVDNLDLEIIYRCDMGALNKTAVYVNVPNKITSGFGEYIFLVHSYEELNCANDIINNYNLLCYKAYPHYNGSNSIFVEDVLFSDIEDILNGKLSKRHIFIHQTLNINYFGHLFVSPSNEVYSNPFSPSLGRLTEGIYSLVCKEMENNYLWRKTRAKYEQCRNCLYRDLCPSPRLEEEIMGRKCHYYIE